MEEKNEQSAQKASGKSKIDGKVLLTIIVVVVLVLGAAGYFVNRYLAQKAGELIAEKIIESGTNGNVDIDASDGSASIKTEDGNLEISSNAEWPSDLPANVPKFNGGEVTGSIMNNDNEAGKAWSITIEKASLEDYRDFQNSLKAKGWEEYSTYSSTAEVSQYGDKTYSIVASFTPEDGLCTISISKDYQAAE